MKIFKNSIYSIDYLSKSNTIKFNWEEGHVKMTYEDFQHACSNFIGFGFEFNATSILIDVRNFQFQLPPEFPEWQETEHYPRYYKLGIEKVAYVMPEEYLPQAKEIAKTPGKFELKNFSSIDEALQFFN